MQGHSIIFVQRGYSRENAQGCRVMMISCRFSISSVGYLFQNRRRVGVCSFPKKRKEALQKIKEKPECNVIYRPPPEPDLGPHSLEEYAFIMLPHIRPPVINHTNSCLVEKPQLHTIIGSG